MSFIKGKGNYRMSKSFGWVNGHNIGVMNVSLGTKDQKEADRIEDAILALEEIDRGDLLHEIKMGTRSPVEVYRMVKGQRAGTIKTQENSEVLKDAIADWLPKARRANGKLISPDTRKSYGDVFKYVQERCPSPNFTVSDLPALLKCFQSYCLDQTPPLNRTFNKARAGAFAFARGTQPKGKQSELYQQLAMLSPASSKRKRERVGLMVWEVREILSKLSEKWRDLAWLQVCTGARSKELAKLITIKADRIIITGTKTDGAVRVLPKISEFTPRFLSKDYKNYNAALSKASGGRITNYDLRSTYRLWLGEAGIDAHRIRRYCGWSTEGAVVNVVEHGYTSTDIDNYLRQDTALLVGYLERNWERPTVNSAPLPKFIPTF